MYHLKYEHIQFLWRLLLYFEIFIWCVCRVGYGYVEEKTSAVRPDSAKWGQVEPRPDLSCCYNISTWRMCGDIAYWRMCADVAYVQYSNLISCLYNANKSYFQKPPHIRVLIFKLE
jgi:hypothetical protein